jgi:hypothetical protein
MTKSNTEIYLNRLLIEQMVREMVLKGESNNENIVANVDVIFHPESQFEMEEYSEAILYGKYSVLN